MTKKAEKIIRIVTVTGPDEVRNCRCAERSKARAIGGGIYSKFYKECWIPEFRSRI